MFLHAQVAQGLGRTKHATRLLEAILARDPNHAWAADFLQEIVCESVLA
ncbi:MAG: hypothetical protein JO022_03960 [Acidobacteriaceae bacterium]|nr:hypothetical protein [Acidobacteriaceae bacterium]